MSDRYTLKQMHVLEEYDRILTRDDLKPLSNIKNRDLVLRNEHRQWSHLHILLHFLLLTTSYLQEFHYKLQQRVIRDWITQSVSYMINRCRQGSLYQHRLWQKVKRHKCSYTLAKWNLGKWLLGKVKVWRIFRGQNEIDEVTWSLHFCSSSPWLEESSSFLLPSLINLLIHWAYCHNVQVVFV